MKKAIRQMRLELFAFLALSVLLGGPVAYSRLQGRDMQNMPGMSMSQSKPKARKKRTTAKKRRPANKRQMGNMPGMNTPGTNMSGMHRRKAAPRRRKVLPPKMDKMPM